MSALINNLIVKTKTNENETNLTILLGDGNIVAVGLQIKSNRRLEVVGEADLKGEHERGLELLVAAVELEQRLQSTIQWLFNMYSREENERNEKTNAKSEIKLTASDQPDGSI